MVWYASMFILLHIGGLYRDTIAVLIGKISPTSIQNI